MSLDIKNFNAFISREQVGEVSLITFNVSNSYEMPVQLLTSHISQLESILSFGAKLIDMEKSMTDQYARDLLFADYRKEIEAKHSQELRLLEKQSVTDTSTRLSGLLQRILDLEKSNSESLDAIRREYEARIKQLQKDKGQIESESATAKSELESGLQKEMRALRKRSAELESDLQLSSRSEATIRDQCRAESQRVIEIIESKSAEILKAKQELLSERESRLAVKEQELQLKLQRQSSSSFRGADGEEYFATMIKERMKWELINTSKIPFSCDYSSKIHGVNTFFEIKNYTNPIPQKEVTKFLRDMKEHPEVVIGTFISLHCPIQGKGSSPITIDWVNGSQCVVYIQSCLESDIEYTLSVIDQTIRLSSIFYNSVSSKEKDNNEAIYEQRIDQAKLYIQNSIARSSNLIRRVQNDKKQLLQAIETNSLHTLTELKQQSGELTTGIQILLGEYSDSLSEEKEEDVQLLAVSKPAKARRAPKKPSV
jgi:hypothetical protein